jgi:hypothetical protein
MGFIPHVAAAAVASKLDFNMSRREKAFTCSSHIPASCFKKRANLETDNYLRSPRCADFDDCNDLVVRDVVIGTVIRMAGGGGGPGP